MVNQNKIFSLELKRQAKSVFPRDVERTVVHGTGTECYKVISLVKKAEIFQLYPVPLNQ